ncbi:MAG: TolC family protein [Candidatus Hydrogenedens sp.]|nr:TolC family protein [Candidatus Hydrogenedens sp.]
MKNKSLMRLLQGMLCCFVAVGCARFDSEALRSDHAISFGAEIEARTAAALGDSSTLDLEQCIAIALDNNLDVQSADVQARIARLNRLVAFSNFLPAIDLNYTFTEMNKTPSSSMLGPFSVAVQDRIVKDTAVQAQMPVFAPATWFLYDAHRHGEAIGALVSDYTRQMIALHVTALYFQCLALEEGGKALASQLESAEALRGEVESFYKEGLVLESELLQIRTLVQARESDCFKNKNALADARSGLLEVMGLSPLASLELKADMPVSLPEGELEDWLQYMLLHHPRLSIADRMVAVEEDKLKIAITEFLPILAVFSARTHTTNSKNTYPYMTATGFTGMMTLFNGFANINEYKAARLERKGAYLAREQESLSLMAQLFQSRLQVDNAAADAALASVALEATESGLREAEARFREGLINTSEFLEARSRRDGAASQVVAAEYMKQVAAAVARNIMGATFRGEEVSPQ